MASIGQFGEIVFEFLRGPEEITREMAWGYAEHAIAGGKARLEPTGERLHQVKLKIRLSAVSGFWSVNPEAELQALEEMARGGQDGPQAHALIIGTRLIGDYAIEKIREGYKAFSQGGALTSAEVELTLKEYQ